MSAAAPKLPDPAELARAKAIGQVRVLMRAAGVRVTEEELRAAVQYVPQEGLLEMPEQLADAIDWHRRHAPGELTGVVRQHLEQLQRDAAAGCAPLTDEEIDTEIDAARAERDARQSA